MLASEDLITPEVGQLADTVVKGNSHPNYGMKRAAQYVRMSTERQCYSTLNQLDAIARYAKHHGIVIVRTFADEGKSGLTLNRRAGLLSLFSTIQSGQADFEAVLVYDVSRWGRFQDADESGYWEFVCKRAGVTIHYCAEPFLNDGSFSAAIIKTLKRAMAAEYSRELSVKVFAGQCRIIELGFHQGGQVGFGFRRLLVDQERRPKTILLDGQMKSIQSDRIVVVPGPEEEQQIVREVFHLFVEREQSQTDIANVLNARGIPNGKSIPWSYAHVHDILVNPKYIGTNIFNRKSVKLRGPAVYNPSELWIRKEGAFPPLVSKDLFLRAAKILELRHRRPTEDEMLDQLRSILGSRGRITCALIEKSATLRKSTAYHDFFGGVRHAYEKLGYHPTRNLSFLECNAVLKEMNAKLLDELSSQLKANGALIEFNPKSRVLTVNGLFSLRWIVTRCLQRPDGPVRWFFPKGRTSGCDLTIIARMNEANTQILDYFLFPGNEYPPKKRFVTLENSAVLNFHRFDTLDQVYRICKQKRVGESI